MTGRSLSAEFDYLSATGTRPAAHDGEPAGRNAKDHSRERATFTFGQPALAMTHSVITRRAK